jgi:hypothetical protein
MTRKNSGDLTNSPGTAAENDGKGVQGPPNKPGQHEKPAGRVTKEGYDAGLRPDVPKK